MSNLRPIVSEFDEDDCIHGGSEHNEASVMIGMSRGEARKQIASIAQAVFAAVFAALVLSLWSGGLAQATEDCIEAPNSQAPQGSHWYYRLDRVNKRKCWYLAPERKRVQQVAPNMPAPAKSLPPRQAETASDRFASPMRTEQLTTQQWPDFTQPTGAFQPSIGAFQPSTGAFQPSTGAFQPSTSATRAPASKNHATVAAQGGRGCRRDGGCTAD
jgi:hypothetical protein